MPKAKAFGAPPYTLQDKLAVFLARQGAYRDEVQRAQTSEAVLRRRVGSALAKVLADKAKAELRGLEANWARYLETLKRHVRPDRRNRVRRLAEQGLVRLGRLGGTLLIQWSGLKAGSADHLLFDAAWYLKTYPDVSTSGLEPLAHYLAFGGQEGRAPHPLFDVGYYKSVALDLGATGLTPLAHYVRLGFARGLSPHPLFDVKYYLSQAPELMATGENPVRHYLRVGAAKDLSPSRLFHPLFYKSQAAGPEAQANPLLNYLSEGFRLGLKPNPLFDPIWFRSTYPEVGDQEPVSYFVRHGTERLLNPSPWFDTEHYLANRGETWLTRLDPLSDYLAGGAWTVLPHRHEGAPSAFASSFPEAAVQGLTPLEYWAGMAPSGEPAIAGLRPLAT